MPSKLAEFDASRLSARRMQLNMSREGLASKVDATSEAIRIIENGDTKSPRVKLLAEIAHALKVNISYFFESEQKVSEVVIEQTLPSEIRVRFPEEIEIGEFELRSFERRFATELDILRDSRK